MNRRLLISASLWLTLILCLPQAVFAGHRPKHVPAADTRNIVTEVDQRAKTVTIRSMDSKAVVVYTLADPKWYKIEIIIDGEQKTFADVVKGLQYMTAEEIQSGVVKSISFCTAANAPK